MDNYSLFRFYLKKSFRFSAFKAFSLLLLASPCASQSAAFPGAIGFGAQSIGWRGGEIIPITNLNDNGKGSFRSCVEKHDARRVCVFNVSGTILLESPVFVASNVYLAGQTAPGNGVQLRLRSGDQTPLIIKNADNVLIRYLKVRPGTGVIESANIDAVTIESSKYIYLDALSLQFASDETFNIHVNKKPVHNITLGRSILSHSLDKSVHPKGKHSKGALICSKEGSLETESPPCGLITIAQNLFAHHRDRNPDVKGTEIGPIEVINNIFYNPISQIGEFYDLLGDVTIHYVGNLTLAGPSTKDFLRPLSSIEAFNWDDNRSVQIYEHDNLNFRSKGCRSKLSSFIMDREAETTRINQPISPLSFTPIPANTVINEVIKNVGANLPVWGNLDALDIQAVEDFLACTGQVIDTPEQVGGWPDLPSITIINDTDMDGLPDDWERTHSGLDPSVGNQAWQDRDQDGWSNIEEYLSSLAGDKL
jgi:pectate lyase